jgi:autotransporter passenger strand-loop-strand repeat protein
MTPQNVIDSDFSNSFEPSAQFAVNYRFPSLDSATGAPIVDQGAAPQLPFWANNLPTFGPPNSFNAPDTPGLGGYSNSNVWSPGTYQQPLPDFNNFGGLDTASPLPQVNPVQSQPVQDTPVQSQPVQDTSTQYQTAQYQEPTYYQPPAQYSYSDIYSYDDGGGSDFPVLLDLTGNGINITQQTSSNTFFDMSSSGQQSLTAWAGVGNGVLFFDPTGAGQLTQANQVVFTDWDPSATSDMQALLDVFDTNHDGALDAGDAAFGKFFVQVTNPDGTQTAQSLATLGIASINLNANATSVALPDGSSIDGETTYTTTGGATRTAATVTFATDPNGYAVTTTTTTNADGSVTIANVAHAADGSVAFQRILNTKIATDGSGATTTTRTLSELDSGGVVTALQTDDTTTSADGSVNETLTNYMNGAISATGALTDAGTKGAGKLNSTTTMTAPAAGGRVVTIQRDERGGGWITQQEVDTTNPDGSISSVVSDLNELGSVSQVTQSDVTDGGLTRTVTTTLANEVSGMALTTTSRDATVVSGSTRTETVTTLAGTTTTSLVQTVTQTTATSVTRTTTSDLADGTTLDLTTVAGTVTNPDSSTTTRQDDKSGDGTLLDRTDTTVTPTSAGGQTTAVTTSQIDGGGFGIVDQQTTTISNAGATQTTTVVDKSADGTERSSSSVTGTVGSPARTVTIYGNGDGRVTRSETVVVNGGTTTDTLEDFNGDRSLVDATVTMTTNGGLSKTIEVDSTGAGTADAQVFDHITTDVTTTSAGRSVETVTHYGASMSNIIDRTQTVVSADGLDTTVSTAFTAASLAATDTWDQISDDQTIVFDDGSLRETTTVSDGAGHVLTTTRKDTSADRDRITTTTTLGASLVTQVDSVAIANDGSVQDMVDKFDQRGDVIGGTLSVTDQNGLSKMTQTGWELQAFDAPSTTYDRTTLNPDGGRSETTQVVSNNGVPLSTSTTLTSPNGLSITTTSNPYATDHFAIATTDATTLNPDGSRTRTVTESSYSQVSSGSQAAIVRTTTTTSANGLSITVLRDLNGDGITDQSSTDITTINSDGSRTEVATDYTGGTSGTVRDVTITHSGIIVAGAGLETTIARQSNGSVPSYQVETILPAANGTVTGTTLTYTMSGGPLQLMTVVTTSPNGLVKTTATAVNGDTTTDFSTTDATVLNPDGSRTETVTQSSRAGLISETVTTTSGNGLSTKTQVDANGATDGSGAPIFNLTTTDDTTLNTADGSRTETITKKSASGATIGQTATTTSADRQTVTTSRRLGETGNATTTDQSETVQTQTDGSVLDTTKSYDAANALLGTIVKTTSGTGLAQTTIYENAAGAVDTQSCTVSYDVFGTQTQDCEDALLVAGTTLGSSVTTQSSGNGQSKTITMALTGALAATNAPSFIAVASDTVAIDDSGATTETIADNIDGAASPNDTTTIVTSADKRTTTTSTTLGNAAQSYIVDAKTTALDGSTEDVTTYYDPANLSVIATQTTVDTSFDGRTISSTTKEDFDGANYNVVNDIFVKNADDTTTETRSNTGSFGAPGVSQSVTAAVNADASRTITTLNYDAAKNLVGQTVAGVSANGLVKSFVYDTVGQESVATLKIAAADLLAGTALPASMLATDIIKTDTTTLNADGSKTEVVQTAYGSSFANLRSKTTSTTSANGLTTTIQIDNDGNGIVEQVDTKTVAPDGSTSEVFKYYDNTVGPSGTVTGTNTYTASADGLATTLTTSTGITDTKASLPDANGSYQFSWNVAAGSTAASLGMGSGSATHDIDGNGIDTWSWNDGSTGGSSGNITIDVATEKQDVAIANAIYMTLLGRDMDDAETQYLARYISNGVLDRHALANALVTSNEYTLNFTDTFTYPTNGTGGTASAVMVGVSVLAAFENALGRLPTAEEMGIFEAYMDMQPTDTAANQLASMAVPLAQYAMEIGINNNRTTLDPNQALASGIPEWISPASKPKVIQSAADGGNVSGKYIFDANMTAVGSPPFTLNSFHGVQASVVGNSNETVLFQNSNFTITGFNNGVETPGGTDTINASNTAIVVDANSLDTVHGNHDQIAQVGPGSGLTVSGTGNSIYLGPKNGVPWRLTNTTATGATITVASGVGTGTLNNAPWLFGSRDTVSENTGSWLDVFESNSTVTDSSGAWVGLFGANNSAAVMGTASVMVVTLNSTNYTGSLINSSVLSGGNLNIQPGGTATNTAVSSGGKLTVYHGSNGLNGTATGTTVLSGGIFWQDGIATNTTVAGGMTVFNGGIASNTTLLAGGTVTVFDGGTLAGGVVNNGIITYDIGSTATFAGTASGSGTLIVEGGGHLDVTGPYSGTVQIDDNSALEFFNSFSGTATFSGAATGAGGTLKFDANSNATITVVNANESSSSGRPSNELDFGPGISDEQLWLVRSGNDLQIDLMGTPDHVTVSNWYTAAGNQLQEITAGGLKLDNQVAQLTLAMATYSSSHSGFDPTAPMTAQAPNDPALQSAIAAAWHA